MARVGVIIHLVSIDTKMNPLIIHTIKICIQKSNLEICYIWFLEDIMDTTKLNPWNWLKKEDEEEKILPVKQHDLCRWHRRDRSPLLNLHDEIDRLFDKTFQGIDFKTPFFHKHAFPQLGLLKPDVDISGTEKEYTITAELPGMTEEDISIELKGDSLILKGEKRQEKKSEDEGYYRVERNYGSFQRVLTVPKDADAENIKAQYSNGVITITLPRKAEAITESKKISIEKD